MIFSGAPLIYVTLLPSWTSVTLEYFLAESKALKFRTSSLLIPLSAFASTRKAINALSVLLPPIICPLLATALLLTPIPVTTSAASAGVIFASESNTRTFPVAISTTERRPSVIVPVLSLKRILKLPAVSRPLIFRTRTLSFAIFKLWNESKMDVSIGKPSGTAQTIMVTAIVIASMMRRIHSKTPFGMLPVRRVLDMTPITIAIAPT